MSKTGFIRRLYPVREGLSIAWRRRIEDEDGHTLSVIKNYGGLRPADFWERIMVASSDHEQLAIRHNERWRVIDQADYRPGATEHPWVRHNGSGNPFDSPTLVDIELRRGEVMSDAASRALRWEWMQRGGDIMRYRRAR